MGRLAINCTEVCLSSGSAAKEIRGALCYDITQCVVVISYRRFGTTYRSYLQGSGIRILTLEDGTDSLSLNVEILGP